MKCLVLDDSKERLEKFKLWLNEPGIELVLVKTAEEALDQLSVTQFDLIYLDHDLGGQTYVSSDRKDCGMEVVRQMCNGNEAWQNKSAVTIVVHTCNYDASRYMVDALIADGYQRVWYQPFTHMCMNNGPSIRPR